LLAVFDYVTCAAGCFGNPVFYVFVAPVVERLLFVLACYASEFGDLFVVEFYAEEVNLHAEQLVGVALACVCEVFL
jgi:hypothetical protein